MDNPEKLAKLETQDTKLSQTKQKHNTTCVRHLYMQKTQKTAKVIYAWGGEAWL